MFQVCMSFRISHLVISVFKLLCPASDMHKLVTKPHTGKVCILDIVEAYLDLVSIPLYLIFVGRLIYLSL